MHVKITIPPKDLFAPKVSVFVDHLLVINDATFYTNTTPTWPNYDANNNLNKNKLSLLWYLNRFWIPSR